MLAPRSSALSSGAIAGAVIGSVVGALLIAFCVFPFVVRARRRRYGRDEDAGLAEMGQAPGGPIFAPQDLDDSSYKRTSGSGADSGTVHDVPQPQSVAVSPQGATAHHSSPTSPVSPATLADPSPQRDDQQVSPLTATASTPPPAEASSPSHHGSAATVGRQSTRDLSVSDSYGPPSRELTAITSVGLTQEPESFDRSSDSREHGHFHLKDSLRSLFHSRQSSQQRRDSRRSTQGGKSESARSPSILTDDVLAQSQSQPQPIPSGFEEYDIETPGEAYAYYHDPTLGPDLSEDISQSALPPTVAAVALPTQVPTLSSPGSVLPAGQAPLLPGDVSSFIPTRPIPEESDAISPDSDATVTPAIFSRQSTFLQGKKFPTSLQRTDSLPTPTIVSDLPSPPFLQYSAGPSGNPMEMMKPTNSTESAWMLQEQMRLIENSPPPPLVEEPVPTMSLTVDEVPAAVYEATLISQDPSVFQPQYQQPPYHSPPLAPLEAGMQMYEDLSGYYNPNSLVPSDYSTPPPSTGPSVQSTPETRLTPYTASPSPPAENAVMIGAMINGQLRPPSPGLSASLSPSPGPPPSPGLSPEQSRGRSPVPSVGTSPGRSPGRSPARPDGTYVCDQCGVVKNSYHQYNHHRRYHDRPYACDKCDLRFGTVTHLNRHINDKHHKTRKFYCTQPDCAYSRQGGKSFPRKDNWKRHMMNKHHIDPKNATDEDNSENLNLGDVDMDGT